MLKEAFDSGYAEAFEKLGISVGQTAGNNLAKAFKVNFTKSVDNAAGLSTKSTSQAIGPGRGLPKATLPTSKSMTGSTL